MQDEILSDYEVTHPRSIGGVFRALGETVSMTARQAKYYVAPYGSGLVFKRAEVEEIPAENEPEEQIDVAGLDAKSAKRARRNKT